VKAGLPTEILDALRVTFPSDSGFVSSYHGGDRWLMGLCRLEYAVSGGMQMPSVNNKNGVHMIGHYHIPVDDHIGVVDRNGFHFDFSNDASIRENDFSIDGVGERAFFVPSAEGDEVPAA